MVTLDTLRAPHEHDHKLAVYCASDGDANICGVRAEIERAGESSRRPVDAFCYGCVLTAPPSVQGELAGRLQKVCTVDHIAARFIGIGWIRPSSYLADRE